MQGQFPIEQAFEPSSSTWEALVLGIAHESKVRTRQDYITLVVEELNVEEERVPALKTKPGLVSFTNCHDAASASALPAAYTSIVLSGP